VRLFACLIAEHTCVEKVGKEGVMLRAEEQKGVDLDDVRGQRHARARQAKVDALGIREG
jgi:hypothetical protein